MYLCLAQETLSLSEKQNLNIFMKVGAQPTDPLQIMTLIAQHIIGLIQTELQMGSYQSMKILITAVKCKLLIDIVSQRVSLKGSKNCKQIGGK